MSACHDTTKRVGGHRPRRLGGALLACSVALGTLSAPTASAAEGAPSAAGPCRKEGASRTLNDIGWTCRRVGRTLRWMQSQPFPPGSAPLARSTVDRPGVGRWDVKFIYATLKDGPDSRRDVSGDIEGIANDVNRYFESQFPGHRLRYDTFNGRLDVQLIQLPITNKELRGLFVDNGWILEDFWQTAMQGAGLSWTHGMDRNVYGHNDRLYVMLVEGFRGPKWGDNGESYEYECTDWDNNWTGISIRFLRKLDGTPCPGLVGHWLPTQPQWNGAYSESKRQFVGAWPIPELAGSYKPWGFTMIRGLIFMMMARCDKLAREIVNTPTPKRPYVVRGPEEMWSGAARFDRPLGHPDIARLDPTHDYYFKIVNGARAGDTCYDIQYSPYWETTSR